VARFGNFNWQESLGLAGVYIVLVMVLSKLSPYFFRFDNLINILVAVSTIGIIAVATTMVIVSGGIDLSIGSVVALSGVAVAQLSHHLPLGAAILLALAVGLVVGLINGLAVTALHINPLIATLGTLSIVRGLAFAFSGGLTQSIDDERFAVLGNGLLHPLPGSDFGIPYEVLFMLGLFLIGAWVMGFTVFGRTIYAVGGNAEASRLAGVSVPRTQMLVYILSGLSAAIGSIFLTSQLRSGAPQAATGIELSVIAAVILGGASLNGGKGTVWGSFLGILIMGTLNNGLTLLSISSDYQDVARGTVLLLAVGLDQLRLYLGGRRA
jgi:ribose transport system permease protein